MPPASAVATRDEEHALITRIAGDAPAGAMMRRYWLPACWAAEVAERDGAPVRVRMLGRNLVAFRDTNGALGLIDAACPHRLASLALGRNEEGGLRCIYHGWKFDVRGRCVEMPTEPPGYAFAERIHVGSYPVREGGGLVWAYLGPPEIEPAFPAYDWTALPRDQIAHLKFIENVNYLQALEGTVDSAHTRFLHRGADALYRAAEERKRTELSRDLAPRLEVADTTYGFRYAAIRRPNVDPEQFRYVKIARFVMPTTAILSRPLAEDRPTLVQIFVPMDDEHTMHYSIFHSLNGQPLDERALQEVSRCVPGVDVGANWELRNNEANWWNQDRPAMKNGSYTGVYGVMNQDVAVQESMGAIVDRSREHLGTSDVAIIRLRRRMLESVRRFMAGAPPIGLESPVDYRRLSTVPQELIGIDEPWRNVGTFPGEYAVTS